MKGGHEEDITSFVGGKNAEVVPTTEDGDFVTSDAKGKTPSFFPTKTRFISQHQ